MSETPSETLHQLPASSRRVLSIGQVLIVLGLCLFLGSLYYMVYDITRTGPEPHPMDDEIRTELLERPYDGSFTQPMRYVSLIFMILGSGSGILALWLSFGLFSAYRRGEIFTVRSARRLNLIGWLIFALAPLDILAHSIGNAVYSRWLGLTGGISIQLKLEDGDIYALVFGLLIVIVSHVMKQAIAISEENREFV